MEELTLNIELSPLALKLRTLRHKKDLDFETLSYLTRISVEDLIAFETDKKFLRKKRSKTYSIF